MPARNPRKLSGGSCWEGIMTAGGRPNMR
jgi:hypothetical protein